MTYITLVNPNSNYRSPLSLQHALTLILNFARFSHPFFTTSCIRTNSTTTLIHTLYGLIYTFLIKNVEEKN